MVDIGADGTKLLTMDLEWPNELERATEYTIHLMSVIWEVVRGVRWVMLFW